jgi:hypothetical protein
MPEGNDREADRRILLNAEGKNRKHKCLVMPSSYFFFSHLGGGEERDMFVALQVYISCTPVL